MTDIELEKLNKKLDKILNLNTKIAKALHLIPVSEKEEREIQIQQRTNLATSAKINSELNAMENKSDENVSGPLTLDDMVTEDIYSDIIDTDYISRKV